MKIKQVAISSVKPYPQNPRKSHDLDKLKRSLSEFGWWQPLVVDSRTGELVVGHGRLEAALALHGEGDERFAKVPVLDAGSLTEDQVRAYRIMDNRSAEGSEWDRPMLQRELEALMSGDEATAILAGFTTGDLG